MTRGLSLVADLNRAPPPLTCRLWILRKIKAGWWIFCQRLAASGVRLRKNRCRRPRSTAAQVLQAAYSTVSLFTAIYAPKIYYDTRKVAHPSCIYATARTSMSVVDHA